MSIDQVFAKQLEKEFEILRKQDVPSRNIVSMLSYIADHETEIQFQLVLAYCYGRIIEKRSERDLRRHNSLATFQNMKAYASMHDGALPENHEELQCWIASLLHTEKADKNLLGVKFYE